jgi:hypothetical protein
MHPKRQMSGMESQREGPLEFDVHIADHVVCQVVADVQMLNLSKLVHLLKDVLVEVLPDILAVSVWYCNFETGRQIRRIMKSCRTLSALRE